MPRGDLQGRPKKTPIHLKKMNALRVRRFRARQKLEAAEKEIRKALQDAGLPVNLHDESSDEDLAGRGQGRPVDELSHDWVPPSPPVTPPRDKQQMPNAIRDGIQTEEPPEDDVDEGPAVDDPSEDRYPDDTAEVTESMPPMIIPPTSDENEEDDYIYQTDEELDENDELSDLSSADDSLSEDSEDEQMTEKDALAKLRKEFTSIVMDHNLSRVVTERFCMLFRENGWPTMPKHGKSIMGRKFNWKPTMEGKFLFIGIPFCLNEVMDHLKQAKKNPLKMKLKDDTIGLQFNVDGLPLTNKGGPGFQAWPILMSTNICPTLVSVVAMWLARDKPDNQKILMEEFVEDLKPLLVDGYTYIDTGSTRATRVFKLRVDFFVCDIPANSLIKHIKG